jgi:hypothetical protein
LQQECPTAGFGSTSDLTKTEEVASAEKTLASFSGVAATIRSMARVVRL